jgi:hypothetical protein
MLIIVGGNIRQKMVDNLTIEASLEMNNHLYFKSAIGQMVRQILIITNNYSMDTKRTYSFSLRVGDALRNCMTLLM